MTNKCSGIALIQILLIVSILSIFALYIVKTAHHQVKIAALAQDRALAEVALHSAESEFFFRVFTSAKVSTENDVDERDNDWLQSWNFHGQSFLLNSIVKLTVQDQTALVSLHYPDVEMLSMLLASQGVTDSRIQQIADRLMDWQDIDSELRAQGKENNPNFGTVRNSLIPDISELTHVIDLTPQEKDLLFNNAGLFSVGSFNPMLSSPEFLSALSNTEAANQIIAMRNNNKLSPKLFKMISGIPQNENFIFYPSNTLSISYNANINNVSLSKTVVVQFLPNAKKGMKPYNILSYSN